MSLLATFGLGIETEGATGFTRGVFEIDVDAVEAQVDVDAEIIDIDIEVCNE